MMDLTLNYINNSNEVKSQNSEGQVGFILGENNGPFDLHTIIKNPTKKSVVKNNTKPILTTDKVNYIYNNKIVGSGSFTGNDVNHADSTTPNLAFQPGSHPTGLSFDYHVYDPGQWIVFDGKDKNINVVPLSKSSIPQRTDTINYQYNNETVNTVTFTGDQWGSDGTTAFQLGNNPKGVSPGYYVVNPNQWIPYDGGTHNVPITLSGQSIIIRIGNSEGYIQDIPIDISNEDDDDKYSGKFYISLSDPNIQNLPPDVYYIEAWVNIYDQNNVPQTLIFPSSHVLPFIITSNIVNGSNSMPMITFNDVQQDWANFKQFVEFHETETDKVIASFSNQTSEDVNEIHSDIANYYDDYDSMIDKFSSQSDMINSTFSDFSNQLSTASLNNTNLASRTINTGFRAALTNFSSKVSSIIDDNKNAYNSCCNDDINKINNFATSKCDNILSQINKATPNKNTNDNLSKNFNDKINSLSSKFSTQCSYSSATNESDASNLSKQNPNTLVFYPD